MSKGNTYKITTLIIFWFYGKLLTAEDLIACNWSCSIVVKLHIDGRCIVSLFVVWLNDRILQDEVHTWTPYCRITLLLEHVVVMYHFSKLSCNISSQCIHSWRNQLQSVQNAYMSVYLRTNHFVPGKHGLSQSHEFHQL